MKFQTTITAIGLALTVSAAPVDVTHKRQLAGVGEGSTAGASSPGSGSSGFGGLSGAGDLLPSLSLPIALPSGGSGLGSTLGGSGGMPPTP